MTWYDKPPRDNVSLVLIGPDGYNTVTPIQEGRNGTGDVTMNVGNPGVYNLSAVDSVDTRIFNMSFTVSDPATTQSSSDNSTTSTTNGQTSQSPSDTTYSSEIQTTSILSSANPSSSSSSSSSIHVNIIVGIALGSGTLLLLLLALLFYLIRRRRKCPRPVSFHREMMVRSPGPSLYLASRATSPLSVSSVTDDTEGPSSFSDLLAQASSIATSPPNSGNPFRDPELMSIYLERQQQSGRDGDDVVPPLPTHSESKLSSETPVIV